MKITAKQTKCKSIKSSEDFRYDWEENGTFEKLAEKQVLDYDGFYTDYTMYKDLSTGHYVFVFGDNDYYSPEDGVYDWECDSEEEAWEWFSMYTGHDEDEDIYSSTHILEDDDIVDEFEPLTLEGFYEEFDPNCDESTKKQAANLLYTWYLAEGEEYMDISKDDMIDMAWACDNEEDKRIVLKALGEDIDDIDDDIYSSVDIDSTCKVEGMDSDGLLAEDYGEDLTPMFEDADYDVIDAGYTEDGWVIVTLNNSPKDVESARNNLANILEQHGLHIVDWNQNGSNVFLFDCVEDEEHQETSQLSNLAENEDYIDLYGSDQMNSATVADNGYQVFQLMSYTSYPEEGIYGDDFYCYGEFFAENEADALRQLEEAKQSYPEFATLVDECNFYVQPFNEYFETGDEVYQNVSAIVQHFNFQGQEDELPFASTTIEAARMDNYFGESAAYDFGDLIVQELGLGYQVSKRKDTANDPGGLKYEADRLGIDMFDLLEALEGMCADGRVREIDDSTYEIVSEERHPVRSVFYNEEEDEDSIWSKVKGASEITGYVYKMRHGWGPGTLPNDVEVLDHWEDGRYDFVKLDRFLSTDELNYYDVEEAQYSDAHSSKNAVNCTTITEEQKDALWDIAERYNTSEPVSGDWSTETAHEQKTIADYFHISMEDAKQLMITELGFTDEMFQ